MACNYKKLKTISINKIANQIKKEYSEKTLKRLVQEDYENLSLDAQEAALFYLAFIKKDINETYLLLKRWFPMLNDEIVLKMANDPYNMLDHVKVFKDGERTNQHIDAFVNILYIFEKDLMNKLANDN